MQLTVGAVNSNTLLDWRCQVGRLGRVSRGREGASGECHTGQETLSMGHYGGICKAISGVYPRSRFPTRESTAVRYLVATRKGVSRNHTSCQTLASLGAKSFSFQCLLKRNVEKKPLGPCVAYVQGCVELGTQAGALAMLAHNLACLIIEQPMVLGLYE